MKTGDYRRDYAAYHSALERTRYNYHMGFAPELCLAPIRDRYADLWSRRSIDELIHAHEETPRQFETEHTALSALIRAAQLGYAEAHATDVTDELARCTASIRLDWNGASLAIDEVPEALAAEHDAARRRELSAHWFDAYRASNDLRAARLAALGEAARDLGFTSHFRFRAENTGENNHAGTPEESLSAGAKDFLARTATVHARNLSEWAARHLPVAFVRELVYADSLFLARLSQFDPYFPVSDLRATYDATMSDLGVHVGRQGNVRIETTASQHGRTRSACFAANPPDDVRLVYRTESGASYYRTFFEAAGRAQGFAWVSRDLAERYPELVHAPDETTRAGFAFLFSDLLANAAWLGAHRHIRPSEASEITRSLALVELHQTRRACAQLQQQYAPDQAIDLRSEHLAGDYATALEEATGFRQHPALYLRDLYPDRAHDTGEQRHLSPDAYLRAHLFAAALGEGFRTRYGHRWWAMRKVADELIDMWNTGSRYTVEELASLNGFGALTFDLLADSMQAALRRE
ncbi:MAG: hypothetical protein ACR2G4_14845 [Pyrinomonadaceae bacterium]